MAPRSRPAILDPSTNNPFAHPSGWLGRLAGRFMLWTNKHDGVLDVRDYKTGRLWYNILRMDLFEPTGGESPWRSPLCRFRFRQ